MDGLAPDRPAVAVSFAIGAVYHGNSTRWPVARVPRGRTCCGRTHGAETALVGICTRTQTGKREEVRRFLLASNRLQFAGSFHY
jgi:hypothetical protein